MNASKSSARFCLQAVVCAMGMQRTAQAQGKAIERFFTAESEHCCAVFVGLKSANRSTETVASKAYPFGEMWKGAGGSTQTTSATNAARDTGTVPKHGSFFADSIATLSLLDGSVARANRSMSRKRSHKIEPVASLPEPPDATTRITISVTIERLP